MVVGTGAHEPGIEASQPHSPFGPEVKTPPVEGAVRRRRRRSGKAKNVGVPMLNDALFAFASSRRLSF